MTPFRAWRKRLGLTQKRAAVVPGVSKRTVENYDVQPEMSVVLALATAMLEQDAMGLSDKFVHHDLAGLKFYPAAEDTE